MYREEQNSHLIFGVRPLEEALDSGASFVKVYVQKGMGDGLRHQTNPQQAQSEFYGSA